MKKKLLASLLALVMVLGMLPMGALAADTPTGVTVVPAGIWEDVDGVKVYTASGNLSLVQSGTDNVDGNNSYKYGYYPEIKVVPGEGDTHVIISRGQNEKAFDETTLKNLLTAAEAANKFPFSQGTDSLANWFQVYATTGENLWDEAHSTYWPNSANAPITNIVLAKAVESEGTTTYTYTKYKFDFSACTIEMPFTTVAGATGTVLGKTIADVQDNIEATLETTLKDKKIVVTGECVWVDSWAEAGFPTNTGNYVALKFTPKANVKTIQVQLTDKTWKTLDTDNTLVWQFNADHDNTTVPMKVTFGDSTHTGATVNYTLDLSGVDEATKPALEVVPANLTEVADKTAPGYGQVGTYTATINNTTKKIDVKAVDLQKTANSSGKSAYWVGIGLTQQAGATYATGWGPVPEPITGYEAADSSQVVGGKTYDTMYWGASSENDATFWTKDTSKTGWVSVKETDGTVTTYTINFDVKVLDDTALLGSEMALSKMEAVGSGGRFNYLLRADRFAKIQQAVITITADGSTEKLVNYKWEVAVADQADKGGLGFEWSLRKLQADSDGYSITGAEATEWEAKNSNVLPAGKYKVTVVATPVVEQGQTATPETYEYEITITEAMRKDVMVERTVTSTVADGKTASVTCTAAGSPAKLYGGETVTVNVTDIQYGYELDKIEVDGVAITGTTFTMPADSNAAVTVTLKKAPLPAATLQYTAVADTSVVSDCAPDTMWVTFEQALPRGTHLWFVITNDKNTNKYEIAADSATNADSTVKFAWSFQNMGQFEKWPDSVDAGSTPGATYTVKGYVLDATGTNATDITGKEAFATWTVKVPEAKVEAPGKTVVDASALPDDMSEADVTAVTDAAASVTVDAASKTVLTSAANDAVKDVLVTGNEDAIADAKAEALAKVDGIDGITAETDTKIVYVPALKVTPKDYTTDEETGEKTLEVDITAVLNAVVTAESTDVNDIKIKVDAEDETADTNAAIVDSQELTISTSITLSITLPENFVTSETELYVLHKEAHYHKGDISDSGSDKVLTFTSTDGLSPFVISTSASPAAKIGETYYESLQDAVNAVKNGEEITLITVPAEDETVTVSGATRTFTIAAGTSGATVAQVKAAISSATGDAFPLTVAYTAPSSGGGSGGGGGGSSATVTVPSTTGGKVSVDNTNAKKGDTVTITATPNTGKVVDTVTVTDADGKTVRVTDLGNGKYSFVMPEGKVTVKVTFKDDDTASTGFVDVPASAYYADAVAWAVEKGITNGTSATTFSPESPCTRAQIVTFLWRAAGSPKATGSNPFTDVKADAYYYDAVLWAVEKNITVGTSATTFSPDDTCTRGQTVTFLYRYAGEPAAAGNNPFADVAAGEYYTNAVLWAVEKEITNGTSATTFSPAQTCTRGQIVTFLYRDLAE